MSRKTEAEIAPLLVAVDMGYGHLRAAVPLAERLGIPILEADRPPLADEDERRLWAHARRLYEFTSRVSQLPVIGRPLRSALERVTHIPHLHPYRDLSEPDLTVRVLDRLARRGLGRGLVQTMKASGAPLLTTFFAPASIADRAGLDRIYCMVTDSDISRAWAPLEPPESRIQYFVPSRRAGRRLRAYGIASEKIELTGFPLPHVLLGGSELPAARRNLAGRLTRLDVSGAFRADYGSLIRRVLPEPPAGEQSPLLTFAVGGAGAQANLPGLFLPSLRPLIERGELRLALVAGVRQDVATAFEQALGRAGLEADGSRVRIVAADSYPLYFARFESLMAETDILWTKPSELTFYGALGIPLVFSSPVGVHERYNRRWAVEHGAGAPQSDPRFAGQWIHEWLHDGMLAQMAWAGFMRLPKQGTYAIEKALLFEFSKT